MRGDGRGQRARLLGRRRHWYLGRRRDWEFSRFGRRRQRLTRRPEPVVAARVARVEETSQGQGLDFSRDGAAHGIRTPEHDRRIEKKRSKYQCTNFRLVGSVREQEGFRRRRRMKTRRRKSRRKKCGKESKKKKSCCLIESHAHVQVSQRPQLAEFAGQISRKAARVKVYGVE